MSDYERIKRSCLKRGELWEDPDFPAVQASVFYHQTPPFQFVWKRPKTSENECMNHHQTNRNERVFTKRRRSDNTALVAEVDDYVIFLNNEGVAILVSTRTRHEWMRRPVEPAFRGGHGGGRARGQIKGGGRAEGLHRLEAALVFSLIPTGNGFWRNRRYIPLRVY
ncbi:hypothetical protein J437_LFUL012146 [Ladona fulva]|uniref:Calpain catalytic domain-containing protein n=1 Tax=Ladona fulva TaxID=123851 RepID=A0A8K0KCZ2_LADFU|nr:hypothetical protein J437_LFUL012146 [Ladona fulva]